VNVEKAKRQLERSKNSVEEIIYSLGYNDKIPSEKIFIRYTDLTPKNIGIGMGCEGGLPPTPSGGGGVTGKPKNRDLLITPFRGVTGKSKK